MVQWPKPCAHNACGLGSVAGQGTRPHMLQLLHTTKDVTEPKK